MSELRCESLSRRPELFLGLPDSDFTRVLARASRREYAFNDIIFWAGDPVNEVLLLTYGRVKITQFTRNGLEVILRLNIPGEIVGVPILEPGSVHCSTAQVLRACSVLAWDLATFEQVLADFPILCRNAARLVAEHLVELQSRFCEVCMARVAPRLARALVRLLDQMGHRVEGRVEINISQEILAQMTAMTNATVSRLLGKWEERGLVQVRRGSLVIVDVPGLARLYEAGPRVQPMVSPGQQA